MEKVNFKNSRNLNLSGILFPAGSEDIVILSHGFTSDKYSRGRFERLSRALNLRNISALIFDFSGCGESDDDSLNMEKETDDLKSAISFVKHKGYNRIALYGHSLGTVISLKAFNEEITAMVLSGAGTDSMKYNWNEVFTEDQMKELHETGIITELRLGELREKIIIEEQMLKDFEQVDGKRLLKNVSCPVLIIHGNRGDEENFLLEKSKRGIKLLSPESKLIIIDGADHSFMEHYDKLMELTCNWFKKWFDRDNFNKMAGSYSAAEKTKEIAGALIGRLDINQDSTVLDIGCGNGVLYPLIKGKGAKYTGIDISKNMVEEFLNIYPEANVLKLDFEENILNRDYFDYVIIYNSIPHFNNLDCVFENAFNSLKPGGTFVIAHSKTRLQLKEHHKKINYKSSKEPIPSDEKLLEIVNKYSFENVKIEDENYFYFSCTMKICRENYWDSVWNSSNIVSFKKNINLRMEYEFIKYFKKEGFLNICDAACGFGKYSSILSFNGFSVSGFDVSPDSVKLTQDMLNSFSLAYGNFKTCSITDIAFESSSFDGTAAHSVIDHLTWEDAGTAINELFRITKKGGLIYISFDGLEEDDTSLPHIVLEDGSFKYNSGKRKGMIFRYYTDEDITKLLINKKMIWMNHRESGEREIILRKE